MNLSAHFTLEEFTKSQAGERFGIANVPDEKQIACMKRLCEKVLEVVRLNLGPVHVNSGFRSLEINGLIGGASSSQHCKGEAADIEIPGIANGDLARWIEKHCEYDQLILECYKPGVPTSGWVHVSFKSVDNRKSELTATVIGGKMIYTQGIHP